MVSLIGTVKEIAITVNTVHQSLATCQGSLATSQANHDTLSQGMALLETSLNTSCSALEERMGGLEAACRVMAESLANQLTEQIKNFGTSLKVAKDA